MDKLTLKKLNHYHEFRTERGIRKVVRYVRAGHFPAGFSEEERKSWETKFGAQSGFSVEDGTLIFKIPGNDTEWTVVLPKDREKSIQEIYDEPTKGLGVGLGAFYQQVSGKYLNIPKRLTDAFLKKQGNYKVTRVPRRVPMSIVSRRPGERFGVDLIDMTMYPAGANHNKKYIMTVVDYFSGKVWARAISNRFNGLTEEEQEKNDEERAYVPEPGEEGAEKEPEGEKEAEPENPPGNVEAPEIVEERAPEPAAGRGQRQKKASAKVRGEGLVGGAGKYLKGAEKGKKKIHKSLTNRKYQKHLKALTTKLMNKRAKEGTPISEEEARAIVMEQERTRPEEAVQKKKRIAEERQDNPPAPRNQRTPNTLASAFESILEEAKTIPRFVQVDNEFNRGGFQELCDRKGIKVIASLSHQSFTNGRVERMNREIRKKTKAGFVRNNDLVWADHLQDYCDNINNQKVARTGLSPNQLWSPGYKEPTTPEKEDLQAQHKLFLLNRAKKINNRGNTHDFKIGDYVRINLTALSSKMREKKKSNFGWNQIAVHYSPEIYQIRWVTKFPKNTEKQTEYIVQTVPTDEDEEPHALFKYDGNGKKLTKTPRRFRGADLIHTPDPNVASTLKPNTDKRAMYLNAFPSTSRKRREADLN